MRSVKINMGKSRSEIFRFKQFEVSNKLSAMKVNTDGVVLGAWCEVSDGADVAWDIGCGTGVIALMLAQRSNMHVYAVDIDAGAVAETSVNIRNSPWPNRIEAVKGDFADIYSLLPRPDLIVSNPPYFTETKHSLVSPQRRKGCARHEGSLSYERLISVAAEVLSASGRLAMISPADRASEIEMSASMHRLYVQRMVGLSARDGMPCSRILWELGREMTVAERSFLSIRDTDNSYTPEYSELVKDFYL